MCSCFSSSSVLDNSPDRRKDLQNETFSISVSTELKSIMVRIVHAGGRIEMYQNSIPASKLIQKYPGMCIARPSVFKSPHESLLSDDDILSPGNKYFVVRSTTVEKLKRKHSRRVRIDGPAGECDGAKGDSFEESVVCSSRDFVVSKESWSVLRKHGNEKRKFVPPIQRPRLWKDEWEPSLTSIQEVSP
ncbi:hypothetical protein DH2020_049654 [Rehmannia glutinosa]|uniref:DUF4228 domain-containing protein n=1 Tax=Rehmannia glutinosa TaxID=99300 RepID=A0ABR0U224_REHGL